MTVSPRWGHRSCATIIGPWLPDPAASGSPLARRRSSTPSPCTASRSHSSPSAAASGPAKHGAAPPLTSPRARGFTLRCLQRMPGHVHRRQAPPCVGHERQRVHREVLVMERTAHHPQRELRAGFPDAQAVERQPAFLAAAGPRTAGDPLHRPGIPLEHHVRRAQKGARPSSHPRTVGQCGALRGFAQQCSRKVQARRSPQLLTSCGLHLLGPSERRPNGLQPIRLSLDPTASRQRRS